MKQLATIDEVIEALKDVIDPELGINVVDLGLVYETTIDEHQVLADLTSGVVINWVWMPPWGPSKITDEGREQLRAIGFTV
jgi:metal-sulfur cluster biosynthetic enzyme